MIAALTVLILTGCGVSAEEPAAPRDSAADASTALTDGATAPADSTSMPAESHSDSTADEANTLTVTFDGDAEDVTFSRVYCAGSPGQLHHMTAKLGKQHQHGHHGHGHGHHQATMLKVSDSNHVLLKLGPGKPDSAQVTEGLTISDETIVFDGVTVADAILDGTLTCTAWDD